MEQMNALESVKSPRPLSKDNPPEILTPLLTGERGFLSRRAGSARQVQRPARIRRNLEWRKAKRAEALQHFGQWMN